MKVACICQYGHSRSVALARILHQDKIPALAAGWQTAGDGLAVVTAWADVVAILDNDFTRYIPKEDSDKILSFHVGPDRWSNPYNQELLSILRKMVDDYKAQGKLCN